MPRKYKTVADHINEAIDAIPEGTTFRSVEYAVKKGKNNYNAKVFSSYLKARIRWEENPTGDMAYDKVTERWTKLGPVT